MGDKCYRVELKERLNSAIFYRWIMAEDFNSVIFRICARLGPQTEWTDVLGIQEIGEAL